MTRKLQRILSRRRRLLLVLGAMILAAAVAGSLLAYFSASATAGSKGASKGATVGAGATPTAAATAVGREVTLSWGASTLSNGNAVDGYLVKRYPSAGGLPEISPVGTCSGTVTALSCYEDDVPFGSWKYTITPVIGTNWQGAESGYSGNVSIGAATLTVNGSPFGNAAFTPAYADTTGSITGFAGDHTGGGEEVTYRLDASTSLTGSPSSVGQDGNATITSLLIPKSAGDGGHTVYALGNATYNPSQASTSIVIDTTAPTVSASLSPNANGAGWNNTSPVVVTLTENEPSPSAGDGPIKYTTDGTDPTSSGTAQTYSAPFNVSAQGTTTVKFYATDFAGNPSTVGTKVVMIDTGAPSNSISLDLLTGNALLSGSTLYYRGANAGSFTLTNAVSDALSGPAASNFAALGGSAGGWTFTPSTVSTPSGGPYTSNTFGWGGGESSSPTETVTGYDAADNFTAAPAITFTDDSSGPTGGSVDATGLVGTGGRYSTSTTLSIAFSKGTDAGVGLASTGAQLLRATASLTSDGTSDGTCGSYGSFAQVGSNDPASPVSDTVSDHSCVKYEYVVPDKFGNTTTYTSGDIKVDSTAPTAAITFPAANGSYNAAGWDASGAITGTAADGDSGVTSVKVAIQDGSGNYYDGSGFNNASITFLAASGTGSWSYAIANGKLTNGHTYHVTVQTRDNASNTDNAAAARSFTYDTSPPTATIALQAGSDTGTSSSDNITNATSMVFDVTFNETVTGLSAGNFSNVGTATGCSFGSLTGSGTSYTITASGCSEGTVKVRLAAAAVTDTAGNANAQTDGSTVTIDRTAPTATITLQAASDTGTSNSDNITKAASPVFNVTFNETVAGLAAGDFSNQGTATGCSFAAPGGSGSSYTETVSSCSGGTLIARLAAAGVTDTAGNGNAQTDGSTVTIDRTAPTATITLQAASDTGTSNSDNITKAASLVFNVTFSESVTGLTAGNFSKGAGTATGCTFGSLTGSGSSYTITASSCSEGTLTTRLAVSAVSDTAGNQNAQTDGSSVTIDRTAPTATIALQAASDTGTSNSDNITNATSLVFDVTFNETVTGLAASNFSNPTGTATGCSFGSLTGSGTSYTITASSCSEGTVKVRLAANAASDTAGNQNAQTDGSTVTIDRTAPTATITLQAASDTGTSNSDNITNASSPVFNVTFSETVAGLAAGDFSNQGTATSCSFAAPGGSGSSYTETVSSCSGGTLIARLAAAGVTDTAGNANAQTDGATVTIDRTAPTVTIALQSGSDTGTSNSDNITNASSLVFNVTFSESVSGLGASDFSNQGTATSCSFAAPGGSGSSYTETVSSCSGGTLIARLAAAGVTDTAGNGNAQTDGSTVTIDRTAPTATITLQAASDTGTSNSDNITKAASLVFNVTFSETVTGLTAGNFSKGAGTATGCTFGSLTGSGSSYTITASSCSEGTLTTRLALNAVSDTAGNQNAQTDGSSVTIDRTAPTVTITGPHSGGGSSKVKIAGTGEFGGATVSVVVCSSSSFPCSGPNTQDTLSGSVVSGGTFLTGASGNIGSGPFWAQATQNDVAGNTGTSAVFGPFSPPYPA